MTCPIFRQHGSRPTEVWHYGPAARRPITAIIRWRHSIKPYLAQEMRKLNATGQPLNRPLWWDFPADPNAWTIDDEYMFGDEYLAAPVLEAGARSRTVYLPTAAYGHFGRKGDGFTWEKTDKANALKRAAAKLG